MHKKFNNLKTVNEHPAGDDGNDGPAVCGQDCQGGHKPHDDAADAAGEHGLAGAQARVAELEQAVDGGAMNEMNEYTDGQSSFILFSHLAIRVFLVYYNLVIRGSPLKS